MMMMMMMRWTAVALALALGAQHAQAQGDVEAGKKTYNKCKSCHEIEAAKNKVGPHLVGILGRTAGAVADFKYSDAMAKSGIVWNEETIAAYLKDPKDYVKGNKMTFVGLKSDEEITNLLAYLKSVQK